MNQGATAKIGFVGLGRMGLPLVQNLLKKYDIVAFDTNSACRINAQRIGADVVENLREIPANLPKPAVIWLMLPMGNPVDAVIEHLAPMLNPGDVLVDGGNADFLDSVRRRKYLENLGIGFAGIGTSGGIAGALSAPPMAVDCAPDVITKLRPILQHLSGNFAYFPEPGKGHLAKTLHNAIEYGMMQSLAEGVALYYRHGFSEQEIADIFKVWSAGSIISSRLVDCLNLVLEEQSILNSCAIASSETSKIVHDVLRDDCATPILRESVALRNTPEAQDPMALTVLARLRKVFGGHELRKA